MRSIELFAGAGGLGLGVAGAGFDHAAVVEWDRWACETLKDNKPWPVTQGDVRLVSYDGLGTIDLVSGGPPCQPFSLGGKHNAHLDHRDMFPEAIRAVRELRPRAFVFENVKGLTRATFQNYLSYIRLQLAHPEVTARPDEPWIDHLGRLERHETSGSNSGLRYNVVLRLLNAANHGVPQRRERIFLVGFRSDLGVEWRFPDETHSSAALAWSLTHEDEYFDRHRIGRTERRLLRDTLPAIKGEKPTARPWLTVRDAFLGLPDPELDPRGAKGIPDHRFIPGARSYPGHTGSPLDAPAKTLKAGVHGVPGGENMLRRPDGSIRYFSVREAARLQTFPDDFLFHGSWTETMRQLGNAVPVRLAGIVARSVADQLHRSDERPGPLQSAGEAAPGRKRGQRPPAQAH
ncbi:DNA (cytosine-5)-methyltransferase 1 [Brevundimonas sp. UYEF29]|jgi:DNA (cytosine-5)-methyltransferase 1|uniref:DNA cytosine methyltransferase n=1 Tax=Brevundimonas TaxID=41275 RepID=UPI0003615B86|nr:MULTISPECIES: DNA cytosine methyltransferase [Brevundimonas]MBK1976553.1 DNA cytosine methyltransferase [Brevundimonas diminuta]MCW0046298.1 DNA cytosine methyltransferase [Brevundimonas sp. BT-123]